LSAFLSAGGALVGRRHFPGLSFRHGDRRAYHPVERRKRLYDDGEGIRFQMAGVDNIPGKGLAGIGIMEIPGMRGQGLGATIEDQYRRLDMSGQAPSAFGDDA